MNTCRPWFSCAIVLAGGAGTCAAGTTDRGDCSPPAIDCVAVGRWNVSVALGAGVRTNPLVHSAALPLVVVPQVSYYGQRLFIDDLELGWTVVESRSNSLNFVASPGYDRIFFIRSDLQNIFVDVTAAPTGTSPPGGARQQRVLPRSPSITYLAGPEWTFDGSGFTGQVDLLHEITGRDHGNELRAAVAIPLIRQGSGLLKVNLGITWQGSAIVRYYFGVPSIYAAASALRPFVKLGYSRPWSTTWRIEAFMQFEHLPGSIAMSPLVKESYVAAAFLGAIYAF